MTPAITTILFGAFDRHNFGDLLFAHIADAMLPGVPLIHAGLTTRDMRCFGGHQIIAIDALAATAKPVNLLHAGGEILTCETDEAASMLTPKEIASSLARSLAPAPYVATRTLFADTHQLAFNSVGGAALSRATPALRAAVADRLRTADAITVRDRHTEAALQTQGIHAKLVPDSGVMAATLFADRLASRRQAIPVSTITQRHAAGFLAIQFSADFADDVSVHTLAGQCDALAAATGLGIVLFRAGAAPLHDTLELYRSVQEHMRQPDSVTIFESLNVWDICALIAASRGYLGSSLHGRILALGSGLPRVSLALATTSVPNKHSGFIEAWEDHLMPGLVPPSQAAPALLEAMSVDPARSKQQAAALVREYLDGCAAWRDGILNGN